jgi:hypothetical protein
MAVDGFYVVSGSRRLIEPVGEDTPTAYATADAAGDAIKNGDHGDDLGPRFVLWVTIHLAATYDRPWAIVRKGE